MGSGALADGVSQIAKGSGDCADVKCSGGAGVDSEGQVAVGVGDFWTPLGNPLPPSTFLPALSNHTTLHNAIPVRRSISTSIS